MEQMASPHTRGWTQVALDLAAPRLSFPAHAGMVLWALLSAVTRTR